MGSLRRMSIALLIATLVAGVVAVAPPVPLAEAAAPPPPWYWQNPQPNGYALNGCDFLTPDVGWAVGDNGVIVRTGDGGHTWYTETSGTSQNLNDVCFIDETTGWAVGANNTILQTSTAGDYWVVQPAPGSTQTLYAICMVTDQKGWIVGDGGRILRTVDGGANWTMDTGAGSGTLLDCDFTDPTHGWAVGSYGAIYTTNGGGTWTAQSSGVSNLLLCVDFITPLQGWAMGDSGRLLRTTNGGASWTPSTVNVDGRDQISFQAVKFTDAMHGWASASLWGQGYLLQTTDGGSTWTKGVWALGQDLYALDMVDAEHGVAVGELGMVWNTDDGSSWTFSRSTSPGTALTQDILYSSRFVNANTGFMAGDKGTFLSTIDGGASWTKHTIGDGSKYFHHIAFYDGDTGWAVGQGGAIYKTTNGGADWTAQTSNTTNQLYGVWLAQGSDTTLWAVGHGGKILKTTDGGTTWVTHTSGTTQRLYDVEYDNGADVTWVAGDGVLLKGTGSGDIWTPVTPPAGVGTMYCVCAANPGEAWVGGSGLYHTDNGGASWTQQIPGSHSIADVVMRGAEGYAVSNSGSIFHTSDSGANWTIEFTAGRFLTSLSLITASTAWAAGEGGQILASAAATPLTGTFSLNEGAAYAGGGGQPQTGWLRLCSSVPAATNMSYRWRWNGGSWTSPEALAYTPRYEIGFDDAPGLFEFEVTYTDGVHAPLVLTDSITMDMTDPTAPTVAAVPLSTTSVRVSWSGATDAGGAGIAAYRVYLGDTPVAYLSSAATQYVVTGLTPSTAYTFKVKAVDGGFRYSSAGSANATTLALKNLVPVYRFYNKRTGAHFYTDSEEERAHVIATWPTIFDFEGPAYYIDTLGNSNPLYRCYNKVNGSHFYTASYEEARNAEAKWPKVYQYEGPTYSVSTTPGPNRIPIYRFYNKVSGSHFYTASAEEADHVRATWPNVFDYEGPAFWIAQ